MSLTGKTSGSDHIARIGVDKLEQLSRRVQQQITALDKSMKQLGWDDAGTISEAVKQMEAASAWLTPLTY